MDVSTQKPILVILCANMICALQVTNSTGSGPFFAIDRFLKKIIDRFQKKIKFTNDFLVTHRPEYVG